MELVCSQLRAPSKREVMRKVFTAWATVSAAQGAARQCNDFLSITAHNNTLEAADWGQIQKLAEHLVRVRRAQAGRD